jgi:hypothetical protein
MKHKVLHHIKYSYWGYKIAWFVFVCTANTVSTEQLLQQKKATWKLEWYKMAPDPRKTVTIAAVVT